MTKRTCSVVVALVRAAAIALCLLLSPAPARANDLVDCVSGWAKTTLNPEQIQKALDFLANHSQCLGYLSDPTGEFAAIVGAIVAVDQAGGGNLLTSAETCQQAIPNLLADVVEKVADSVGGAIGLEIPADVKSKGHEAVVAWVNSLKDEYPISSIAAELDCGCAVAAYGKEGLEQILHDVVDTAKACGGVIGDIAEVAQEVVDGIKGALENAAEELGKLGEEFLNKLGEYKECLLTKSAAECAAELGGDLGALFGEALKGGVDAFLDGLAEVAGWAADACCFVTIGNCPWGDCSPPDPPPPPDLNCKGVMCGAGLQCGGDKHDHCVPCANAGPTVIAQADGTCGCINGFKPQTQATAGGPVVVGCTCEAPKVVKSLLVTAICTCPHEGEVLQSKGGTLSCGCPLGKGLQNGKCEACESWQKSAGGQCQDRCPNGVWVDPNAPASTPKVSLQSPSAPRVASTPSIPGQGGAAQLGPPGNVAATPSAVGLPGSGAAGEKAAATGPLGLPGSGGGAPGDTLSAKPVLTPMCIPCRENEYVENNQCHSCGTKAVVNLAAKTCTPCGQGQVAKLMAGALTCAADCSRFGRIGANVRSSSNYITDPNDKNRCIACGAGSKPNATHTACITTVSVGSQPEGPVTATGVPASLTDKGKRVTKEKVKGTVVRVDPGVNPGPPELRRQKSKAGTTSVKLNCPPRMHPNPRGTGCVPDLDMPGISGGGSGPHRGPATLRGSRGR